MQAELAEQALLGACILNNKAPLIASDFVDATDFYLPKHQVIFAAILSLIGRGADADPVSVCSEIGPDAERAYVFSLPQLCPSASNVSVYAQAVRDAALDRRVRKAIENASQHRGNKLLSQLQEQLYQLDKRVERSVTMAEVWTRMRDNFNVPLAPGCEYPWSMVQRLTRGMRPGWLCILAGEPSHGKTAGALEVTEKAIRQGRSVAFLSLEMNEEEIALRLAQRYGMSSDRYYESKLNDHDESIIGGLSEESHWRNLHLEKVERAAQIGIVFRRWKPDLVVVDHLQLLAGSEDVKELSKTTRTLKLMAERFDTPILCLSQLSRAHGEEQNRLPKLTRLRGSGTIEQDSDTVVFVWRKRDELETLLSESALVVAKSRMGKLGAVRTSFDGDSQTFRPITQDYA